MPTAGFAPLRSGLAVTSTHMVITEPVPDLLEEIGWTGGECISTARIHVHYFRTTPDGRIAFGSGGGRMAYGARLGGRIEVDPAAVRQGPVPTCWSCSRVCAGGGSSTPGAARSTSRPTTCRCSGRWPGAEIHYAYGFTGNGVGPSRLAGTILARMALDRRDELTRLAIVEPSLSRVPPEPARYVGGTLVRAALNRKEASEDAGRPAASPRRGDRRVAAPARDPHRALRRAGSADWRNSVPPYCRRGS